MKKKIYLTKLAALSLSVIVAFSACHNSRFDKVGKETTSSIEESTDNKSTEKETETKDNDKKPAQSNSSLNPKDKKFTEQEKAVQKAFDEYLDAEYKDSLSQSLVSTHFELMNPEAFGITEYASIWGDVNYGEDISEEEAMNKEAIKTLKEFKYSSLTYEQQLTYDTLMAYLENSTDLTKYYYYGEVFSPSSGAQFELPLILSEYALYDEDDIKDYLTVLESCDEYMNSLIEYEKWRGAKGYAMTDKAIDDVIGQCEDILAAAEPAFVTVISESIDKCSFIDDTAKANYKATIKQLAIDNFMPAYNNLKTELATLKGLRSVEGGLCNYEDGDKYYTALLRQYVGSPKNPRELITAIDEALYEHILRISLIYSKDNELYTKLEGPLNYVETEPDKILSHLTDKLKKNFPTPATTDYDLKYVAKSMESSSNPAFYLIPPYDNSDRNIIYVNPSEEYKDMDLLPLLAHEGFPGHLYQHTYFLSLNPHPIRTLLSFNGYSEGWAKYVEHYSYEWSGLDSSVADMLAVNDQFGFAIHSRVDLGVNYEGWDVEDIEKFLANYVGDTSIAEELYEISINDPGIYLQYYVGELELNELYEEAQDLLDDDFNEKDFHEFFLSVGPTYFELIQERMYMWID